MNKRQKVGTKAGRKSPAVRRARSTAAGRDAKPATRRAGAAGTPRRILRARDLMTRKPITVTEGLSVGSLCDLLQARNINGAPVVDEQGYLLGVVTQEDIIYGAMGHSDAESAGEMPVESRSRPRGKRVMQMLTARRLNAVPSPETPPGEIPFWSNAQRTHDPLQISVGAIMTSPAISADEMTPIVDLCRIMWNLRIHRVPILKHGKVTGLVSSMDLCRAVLSGKIVL